MKVCFVGLGSIGTKHLKNLKQILDCKNEKLIVHAYREGCKTLSKDVKDIVDKEIFYKNELDNDYDVVFIANPTNKHYETLKLFSNKTINMFIEKPVFDKSNISFNKIKNMLNINGIYYVAAPLRYTEVLKRIKNIVSENEVFSVRSICSSYLPDWRPNVDYREVYSAHKEQGGGVSIDCIHELDYIFYLFGFPEKSFNLRGKYSHLEIDSEDLSLYLFKYNDKIVELHLDYFSKNKERTVEIYTKQGVFKGDFYRNQIIYPNGEIEKFDVENNQMYLREMNTFLKMIEGKVENKNSIEHSMEVLKFAEGDI